MPHKGHLISGSLTTQPLWRVEVGSKAWVLGTQYSLSTQTRGGSGFGKPVSKKGSQQPWTPEQETKAWPKSLSPPWNPLPCTSHSQFSGRFLPHGLSQLQFPQADDGCAEYSLSLSFLFSVPGSTSSSQPQPLETLPAFAQGPASAGSALTTEGKREEEGLLTVRGTEGN